MSFNKKTIYILMILIMAAALAGCAGQTAVPTATTAPTVEEPTAAPTVEEPTAAPTEEAVSEPEAEAVEEKADEAESAEPEAEAVTTDSEKSAEEPASETGTETNTTETSDEKTAENEADAEKAEEKQTEEEPADETIAVEAPTKDTAETADTEETVSATEETADAAEIAEEPAAEAADAQYPATVDGEGISLEDFKQMAIFNRYQYLNQYAQYAQMYSMYGLPIESLDAQVEGILGENGKERLGSEVIDQLIYDKVLKIEAEKEGLELSDEEVYTQLKNMFGYEEPSAESESPMGMDSFNVDPSATESDDDKFAAFRNYAESILAQGYGEEISFDFIENYAKNVLLDNLMFEADLEDRVFEAEMVNARHILVEDEETAKEILAKLEAGEEWDTLASENSLDTANKDNSGSLGWFGRGEMVAEFEEAAFELEPGEISEPVKTSFGYHIIASDGKEIRPLNGAALQAAQNEAYDEWTLELRSKHDIQSYPDIWMDAVPMEPAFVSLNPAPAADETTEADGSETKAEAETTEETADVETVEEVPAETPEESPAAEAEAAVVETTEETAAAETVEEVPTVTTEESPAAEDKAEATEETASAETVEEVPTETPEESPALTAETETESEEKAEADTVNKTVVGVINGTDITADEFVEMAVFNRYQVLSSYQQYVQYASMFGFSMDEINDYYENLLGESGKEEFGTQTIDQLFYSKMLEFEAEEMGITVSRKDAENQMKKMFGYEEASKEAEASLGLDSFNLEAELSSADEEDQEFKDLMDMDISVAFDNKVSYDFYLEYIRHSMIENAIADKLVEIEAPEPKQEEQVNARHILVEDEETANEIIAKLDAGEDWDALAAEYSLDSSNKDLGGALGWFGHGVMVSEFEDAAFALEPGEISDPIQTSFGWHIIASDGKEMRPTDDIDAVRKELYDAWYEGLTEKYQSESYPEIWLPLVPEEPVFTPIEVEVPAEGEDNIPTFHIISDENGNVTSEEVTIEPAIKDEDNLTIENTEQSSGVVPEEEKELTINNTEQDVDAYIINNDAENTDQANDKNDKDKNPEIKPTKQPETTLLLTNDKENK